uniref:Uncharacterized protein n=1 Tax=Anguilla anguilla TaxID=7936 RepID=A0A0E9RXR6_ANGAN
MKSRSEQRLCCTFIQVIFYFFVFFVLLCGGLAVSTDVSI